MTFVFGLANAGQAMLSGHPCTTISISIPKTRFIAHAGCASRGQERTTAPKTIAHLIAGNWTECGQNWSKNWIERVQPMKNTEQTDRKR